MREQSKTDDRIHVQKSDDDTSTILSLTNMNFLACGAFSNVYSGTAITETNQQLSIVIKKVWPSKKHSQQSNEIEILKMLGRLKHKNIVFLLYTYTKHHGDNICMGLIFESMPFNLQQFLRNQTRKIDIIEVKLITWQLFRGQAHIQRMDICHRDIKPQNLLYNPETGLLKITDFGSSLYQPVDHPQRSYQVTRYYRPPELILGAKRYGCEIDIWSCGCVFGELLKGRVFFAGHSSVHQADVIFDAIGLPTSEEKKAMQVDKKISETIINAYESDTSHSTEKFTYMYEQTELQQERSQSRVKNDRISTADMKKATALLRRILVYTPKLRMTGQKLLTHKFFSELFTGTPLRFNGRPIPCLTKKDLEKVNKGDVTLTNESKDTQE
ncbi:hypothetical protein CRE_28474 [Caenorhabditis remanei]|uniref:Protein kinase domain-containing protein n=1 Tax=Caenorhabditis remanei TaxID=31234 RepID=E3LMM8_CAERE|nr:hypothetical protein CRE_28474 [Caenorhabditis remanei]